MRSILWIGRGTGRGCNGLSEQASEGAKPGSNLEAAPEPQFEISWVRDAEEACELPLAGFDALVLDELRIEAIVASLARLQEVSAPIFVRLQAEQAEHIATLLHAGAFDVVFREGDGALATHLEKRLRAHEADQRARAAKPAAHRRYPEIIGESEAMRRIFELLERAQRSNATVLIRGETGTGKEALARAIHRYGKRSSKEFVAVNCAAFSETLLESELFGHVRGAFTGADFDKKGLFEQADGGTLFLDEIGETSPAFQAKLLRALQEGEIRPVGSSKVRRVDVRIVAATNRDLHQEVKEKNFREDLFYRISVFPIDVPPLRERTSDIALLARHFLREHGRLEDKPGCTLALETEQRLACYAWPGNVRELENEIQRLITLSDAGAEITPNLLSERIVGATCPAPTEVPAEETLRQALDRVESWMIRRALHTHRGHRSETARRLGLTREGLYKKMRRLGI